MGKSLKEELYRTFNFLSAVSTPKIKRGQGDDDYQKLCQLYCKLRNLAKDGLEKLSKNINDCENLLPQINTKLNDIYKINYR